MVEIGHKGMTMDEIAAHLLNILQKGTEQKEHRVELSEDEMNALRAARRVIQMQ